MKKTDLDRTFVKIQTLTEGKTSKYEAKVNFTGLGVKWVAVYAEDWRAAQKALHKMYGAKNVKTKPTRA